MFNDFNPFDFTLMRSQSTSSDVWNTCFKVNPFFIMTGQKAKLNDWKERYLRNKEYPLHSPLSYYGGEWWIRISGSATYLVQGQLELCRLLRSRQNQVSAGVVHTEIVNVKSGFKHCVRTFQARENENQGPVNNFDLFVEYKLNLSVHPSSLPKIIYNLN